MLRIKTNFDLPVRGLRRSPAIFSLAFFSLFSLPAYAADPLDFFKNWVITGDYALGGIGLKGLGVNGFAEGNITIPTCSAGHAIDASCVPANTELLAALLYWEAKEATPGSGKAGAQIKSLVGADTFHNIYGKQVGNPNTPPCWSDGSSPGSASGSSLLTVYFADVLRWLKVDAATGARAPSVRVHLPSDNGNGNNSPSTNGASLVIIW